MARKLSIVLAIGLAVFAASPQSRQCSRSRWRFPRRRFSWWLPWWLWLPRPRLWLPGRWLGSRLGLGLAGRLVGLGSRLGLGARLGLGWRLGVGPRMGLGVALGR